MTIKPPLSDEAQAALAVDLFCGLGGWSEGLLAEGWQVVGVDIEEHVYGEHRYPAGLIIQDVRTVSGSAFSKADLIVASPPCQEYSYMAMPWTRAKAKAAAIRADETGAELKRLNELFNECFRIQREASAAKGVHIPLIIENVRGAQPWVGRARWSFGSFFLWGDVPALMPFNFQRIMKGEITNRPGHTNFHGQGKPGYTGQKVPGFRFDGSGRSFQSASVEGVKQPGLNLSEIGFNVANAHQFGGMVEGVKIKRSARDKRDHIGVKRKFASAMIAKIPLALSRHIAATFHPSRASEAA